MDYRALTTLRETLDDYANAVNTAANKPETPLVPAVLRQAANKLPPKEVIRELEALPHNINRVFIIREICQPSTLRRAALQSSLLKEPKYNNPRNKRIWYKALGHLVDAWQPLESENGDEVVIASLRQLRKCIEEVLPRNTGNSLSLATLLVTADARLQKVELLRRDINNAVALLEKGQSAYAHDGLQEVVQSLWAQIRSEYCVLSPLTKQRVEGSERDVVISRIEDSIAALRARYTTLIGMGFHLPGLEVARGEGRERVDEDDEDEWEDVWEEPVNLDDINHEDVDDANIERATAKPNIENDGIERFLKGQVGESNARNEVDLPPVTDWVAAIKGDEGDKMNRLLLDRLEEKAALETNEEGVIGVRNVASRGRGLERRGRRGGRKTGTTARQRLSAALGIKKRKRKSLLD